MTRRATEDTEVTESTEVEERLEESRARIEALEASTADAEARASSTAAELAESRERLSAREAELAALEGEAAEVRSQLEAARAQVRETAVRYRAARLASAPTVPAELVPESEDVEEIERGFEAALRVVGQVRERVQEETESLVPAARVPAGAPARRRADLSALSASEKIRVGLEAMAEREGR